MGMGSFLRNGSCTHQFWIELTIAFRACRERPPDFSWLVTLDDIDRGGFAGSVFKYEFGWFGVGPGRRRHRESRSRSREKGTATYGQKRDGENFSHWERPL